jgi:heterodisulfide reductase subunit C
MTMIEEKVMDPQFKYQVASRTGGEGLLVCFSCGVCTAGCPVSEVEEGFNPRRIIHQILLGQKEELLTSKYIWMCVGCYRCTAHCPQDVEFTNILKVLREIAVEEGYVSKEWKAIVEDLDRRTQKLRRDCLNYLFENAVFSLPQYLDFYKKETGKLSFASGGDTDEK